MADPYSKAIIQNSLQQRLLSQTSRQIDCKRRKALNQIWFDKREIYRELVCIRTKTPSLSAKSSISSQNSVSSNDEDRMEDSPKSLGSSISALSNERSIVSSSIDTTIQSSRSEKRLKPKQKTQIVTISPKTVKRIEEVKSIHLNLERLTLAIEQRGPGIPESKLEECIEPNNHNTDQIVDKPEGQSVDAQTIARQGTSQRSRKDSFRRETHEPRPSRSLSS